MSRLLLIFALLFAPPAPRLVVMGDSVAYGVGASAPAQSWAALVATAYGLPLTNAALSGSRVAEQPIPHVNPGDTVIWLVGYNDMRAATSRDAFRATVQRGVASLQAQGATVVLVGGLRMSASGYTAYSPQWSHGSDKAASDYADAVRDLATFVDLGGFVPNEPDMVHPDDAGHAAIAAAILTPNLTTQWQGTALHVTWHAPGYHCLYLDRASLDCRYDSADLLLRTGGIDHLYAPHAGQVLRLIDYSGNETARAVVPARVYRVVLVWVRR